MKRQIFALLPAAFLCLACGAEEYVRVEPAPGGRSFAVLPREGTVGQYLHAANVERALLGLGQTVVNPEIVYKEIKRVGGGLRASKGSTVPLNPRYIPLDKTMAGTLTLETFKTADHAGADYLVDIAFQERSLLFSITDRERREVLGANRTGLTERDFHHLYVTLGRTLRGMGLEPPEGEEGYCAARTDLSPASRFAVIPFGDDGVQAAYAMSVERALMDAGVKVVGNAVRWQAVKKRVWASNPGEGGEAEDSGGMRSAQAGKTAGTGDTRLADEVEEYVGIGAKAEAEFYVYAAYVEDPSRDKPCVLRVVRDGRVVGVLNTSKDHRNVVQEVKSYLASAKGPTP